MVETKGTVTSTYTVQANKGLYSCIPYETRRSCQTVQWQREIPHAMETKLTLPTVEAAFNYTEQRGNSPLKQNEHNHLLGFN